MGLEEVVAPPVDVQHGTGTAWIGAPNKRGDHLVIRLALVLLRPGQGDVELAVARQLDIRDPRNHR